MSAKRRLAADLDHILKHTAGMWDELRGQRLFLTGGTGFFGCWLLESFTWANDKLGLGASATVLTRDPAAFRRRAPHLARHSAVNFHSGDVRSFLFPEGRFTHIIHGAASSDPKANREDPLLNLDTIVLGARRTLDFAVECGAEKFLMISCGEVYGRQPPETPNLPEEYPGAPDMMDPESACGEGKRMAELLCTLWRQRHGLETKIARCFGLVGPYLPLDRHFGVSSFLRDEHTPQPGVERGPMRSYLYAADLMVWLWTILFRGEPCRPYNVGSEAPLTVVETALEISTAASTSEGAVRIRQKPRDDSPLGRYVPSTARARRELHLAQHVPLEKAIQQTTQWFRETRPRREPG
jgi:nucleoside-diphosphate-sugar epimerase